MRAGGVGDRVVCRVIRLFPQRQTCMARACRLLLVGSGFRFAAAWLASFALVLPTAVSAERIIDLGSLESAQGFRISGSVPLASAGHAVATVGDMNGDGLADFAIGAPLTGEDRPPGGTLFILFGRREGFPPVVALGELDGTQGFRVVGDPVPAFDQGLGWRVTAAGDVNADGLADVLVNSRVSLDAVVLFGSRAPFPPVIDAMQLDGARGFRFGGGVGAGPPFGIAGGFDLNRDGIADLAIGCSIASFSGLDRAGRLFVLFGRADGFAAQVNGMLLDGSDGFRVDGTRDVQLIGDSLANAGDTDADGFDDLLFTGSAPVGALLPAGFVIHARSTGFPAVTTAQDIADGRRGFAFVVAQSPSLSTAAGLGDINGDGFDDVAIARSGDLPNPIDFGSRGSTYVAFGAAVPRPAQVSAPDFDGRNGLRIDGSHPSGYSGLSIAGVGDFNADGIDDFAIGASVADVVSASSGLAWLLYGRAGAWPARLDLTHVPEAEGLVIADLQVRRAVGAAIAGAGDVNRDGGQDLLVGTPGGERGGAHVLYGVSQVLFADSFD